MSKKIRGSNRTALTGTPGKPNAKRERRAAGMCGNPRERAPERRAGCAANTARFNGLSVPGRRSSAVRAGLAPLTAGDP